MPNKNSIKSGFTLLEMVVVIALIGITMAIIIPGFRKKNQKNIQEFRENFTILLHGAYLNALEKNKFQKIYVDIKNSKIQLQEESGKDKLTGDLLFSPLKFSRFITEIILNPVLEFQNFYVTTKQGTKDQMAQAVNDIWFFITPDGVAQDVVINLIDMSEKPALPQAGLILNPFTLTFKQYDEFKKLS